MRGSKAFRRRRVRLAVVVQIDNLTLLTRCTGVAATARVLAALADRLGALLRVPAPPTFGCSGQTGTVIEAPDDAIPRIAAQLRTLLRDPATRGGPVSATLSGVVVRGGPHVGDQALLETARRHLARGTGADLAVIDSAAPTRPPFDPDWIEPYFQPQLCRHSGAVAGFELLARIDHPRLGLIGPATFLPALDLAEQRLLTRVMLGRGLSALALWAAAGHVVDTVSLNVTAMDLRDPQFADFVLWELDRQDVAPQRLIIEVIEEMSPLDMPEAVRTNLLRLAHLGCGIDLDDFGTGYASFEALRRLPVRRVKIDRSFVTGCDRDPGQQRMLLGLLAMADRLGIDALAEGVETAAEHGFVAQIGCTHVQGYAVARPMALPATLEFLGACQDAAEGHIRRSA